MNIQRRHRSAVRACAAAVIMTVVLVAVAWAPATAISQCTIWGTAGDDIIEGTPGSDRICALGGDDIVRGKGGGDVIWGHGGNDVLLGGGGRDGVHYRGRSC